MVMEQFAAFWTIIITLEKKSLPKHGIAHYIYIWVLERATTKEVDRGDGRCISR